MKFLNFSFLVILNCCRVSVAQANSPISFFLVSTDTHLELQIPSDQSIDSRTQRILENLNVQVLPSIFQFFKNTKVLMAVPRLRVDIVEQVHFGYCAFVPSGSKHQILIAKKCLPSLSILLAHEYWHVLTNHYAPNTPSWLNEGLAETFASRITGILPLQSWQQLLNAGITPSLLFSEEGIHPIAVEERQEIYGFNHLFAMYLYDHYGEDNWLLEMLEQQKNGKQGISAAVKTLNHRYFSVDEKYLGFNSLFLNFVMALNLNSTLHAPNQQFSLATSTLLQPFRNSLFFATFDILNEQGFWQGYLTNYQTQSLKLASSEECLQWRSSGNGRTHVYSLKRDTYAHSLRQISAGSCFSVKNGETLSLIQFEGEADIHIEAKSQ